MICSLAKTRLPLCCKLRPIPPLSPQFVTDTMTLVNKAFFHLHCSSTAAVTSLGIIVLHVSLSSSLYFQQVFVVSNSYNPLPRAAGKIQYEAEAKPRPSNCILLEAEEVGCN